ncbi:MAG: Fic family protein [Verrucomicrobia bacterium]|nr:Fic family protein [Verrucomicrobiota bacterium]
MKFPPAKLKTSLYANELKRAKRALLPYDPKVSHPPLFSKEWICKLHQSLGLEGVYRDRQNWIGPKGCSREEAYFFPPPASDIEAEMDKLISYGNQVEKEPLVQLALFFAKLLIIHPFMDGNGRLARAIVPYFLYSRGMLATPNLSVTSYFKKHRLRYFQNLYNITDDGNWESWIAFFLKCLQKKTPKISSRSHPKRSETA